MAPLPSEPASIRPGEEPVLAAIDVGTNAVRLEIARPLPDGSLETLHQERDAVRPGDGVFTTGGIPPEVADRLLSTLRRYAALCKRFGAVTRAVATSALRESNNREAIVRRARKEAGLELEVVSGKEEARLICLGVLHGKPSTARSLVVDIGGGSTEVAYAVGDRPQNLWSVPIGAVRLTQIFEADGKVGGKKLELMRRFADEAFREAIHTWDRGMPRMALGSSGTINAVLAYASADGAGQAGVKEISRAVDKLASLSLAERRQKFDSKRAEIIVAGAVVLETAARHLRLNGVSTVDRGLRDGLLFDLVRRVRSTPEDSSLADAAIAMGRRFDFDEAHARQVARLAVAMYDRLGPFHGLLPSARTLLEIAALLHDIGHAVSAQKHHKHTYYLVQNADLPGITDHEREIVALIARFHRRSSPERPHELLTPLSTTEYLTVRKLSTFLRMADSLDRSHQQPIKDLGIVLRRGAMNLHLKTKGPVDLELWDAERETALFRRIVGRRISFSTGR